LYRVPAGHVTRSGRKSPVWPACWAAPGGPVSGHPRRARLRRCRRAPGTGCRRTATAAVPGQCSRVSWARAGAGWPGAAAGRPGLLLPSGAADCAACLSASGEPHSRPPVLGIGAGTGPGRYIITPAVEAHRSGYAVTRGDPGVMAACRGQ
jgi:hypothetical protein